MRPDVADWVALNMIRGIGPRTAHQLIERFGSPAGVFAAPRLALEINGLKPETIADLQSGAALEEAHNEIERCERLGARIITHGDEDYPELLAEIYDPPIVLYLRGSASAFDQPAIAVVGSRRASTYGVNAATRLARELAARGVTIVSGLARGIDAAAHRGALQAPGATIAVIGTGLATTYPKEHARLSEEIATSGALVTEFPLATPPLAQNFPYRNRVLSGLCLGVVVVEASEHSGSLITARLASEQGREVFAVPGNITSGNSFGPHALIRDGAKLVERWEDVIEELPAALKERILAAGTLGGGKTAGPAQPAFEAVALSEAERRVLKLLRADEALHIDQLLECAGLSASELMSALLGLEMKDKIRRLPGNHFVLIL